MVDPVRTIDGDVFEREAITRWLQLRRTNPLTNMPIQNLILTPDRALKGAIEECAGELVRGDVLRGSTWQYWNWLV